MFGLICKVFLDHWKPFWSAIRWGKQRKEEAVPFEDVLSDDYTMTQMLNNVNTHFDWQMDDASQLWDSYQPVEFLYNWYVSLKGTNEDFVGDCDDCHSVIYHILKNNGYDCVLFTIATRPITQAHTMVIYKENGCYTLVNYRAVTHYPQGTTIQDIVDNYNKKHNLKKEWYWNMHRYDYEKNKFYTVDKKDF